MSLSYRINNLKAKTRVLKLLIFPYNFYFFTFTFLVWSVRTYKTEGIIIKRRNYGEADRILTIFTKHYGKIKAIAKGIRRIKSRRGPHLEIFNQATLFLVKGKNFDIITEALTINNFPNLRKDLKRIAFSYQVCELTDQLTREGQVQKKVYNLLVSWFSDLNQLSRGKTKELEKGLREFEIRLLKALGFLEKDKKYKNLDITVFIERIAEKKLRTEEFLKKMVESV